MIHAPFSYRDGKLQHGRILERTWNKPTNGQNRPGKLIGLRRRVAGGALGILLLSMGSIGLSACGSAGTNNATPIITTSETPIPTLAVVTPTPGQPGGAAPNSTATTAAKPTQTPQTTTNGQSGSYTVQAGDTLYTIAVKFNVTIQALMKANSITDPTSLQAGQVLVIP